MLDKILMRGKRVFYILDGKEVSKRQYEKRYPPPKRIKGPVELMGSGDWSKPILSDALAVHPDQIQEAIESSIAKGVPTEFTSDGRPILRSRQHRNKYLKAYKFFDRNAGYGDTTVGTNKEQPPDPEFRDYFHDE